MTEYTVTRDSGEITIHEADHDSPALVTFRGFEGEELFDIFVTAAAASGTTTLWDANRAEYLT